MAPAVRVVLYITYQTVTEIEWTCRNSGEFYDFERFIFFSSERVGCKPHDWRGHSDHCVEGGPLYNLALTVTEIYQICRPSVEILAPQVSVGSQPLSREHPTA
jgi:hypothetical protein